MSAARYASPVSALVPDSEIACQLCVSGQLIHWPNRAFRPHGHARQTHAIVATGSFENLLPQIVAPTQVIHGLSDPLMRPACGQRSARLIGGSRRLALIPGMGHDLAPSLMPHWAELIAGNAARV